MSLRNTETSYGSVAKFFHWLIAILVIGMLVFGYFLDDFPKNWQGFTYNLHKLIGLTVLSLMVLRLIWALMNVKPALPAGTPAWQRSVEKAAHGLIYGLVILMPLSGWIGAVAGGRPPHLGGFKFDLPIPENDALFSAAYVMHGNVALLLIALLSLHVLAAFYHHFILKDNILVRMWPGR